MVNLYVITNEDRLITSGEGSERTFVYEYNLKDHLGNNRVSFIGSDLGGAIDVTQSSGYYPFGMVMFQNNNVATTGFAQNKYLYNGKELQDDAFGGAKLNRYDYGARFYDAQIGRFTEQDKFAEKYINMTPYQYGANNPIRYIDVNGDSIQAKQVDAQQMIINTLTKEDAKYVKYDKNGNVNLDLLNSHKSESGNYVIGK